MLTTTISGGGLRGNNDMKYLCTARSCSGQDQYTDGMFRAMQAQLIRLYDGAAKVEPKAAAIYAKFRPSGVDGKIGVSTVNSYKFLASSLERAGKSFLPIPSAATSKETLAQQAEAVARTIQAINDKQGFPPADVSIPGMPSANSAGSFGPSTSTPSITISTDQARKLLEAARGTALNPSGLPDEGGIPASELVSQNVNLPGGNGSTPFYKNPFVIGGGLLGIGLAVFFATRRK